MNGPGWIPVTLILLLSACSSSEKRPEYAGATTVAPLELPAGLSPPDTGEAYTIPAGPRGVLPADGLKPPVILASSRGLDTGFITQVLQVHDRPDSVWHRLGFAIVRTGLQVVDKDEKQHSYIVSKTVRVPLERNWLSRILFFWRADHREVQALYRLEVRPEGEISRIFIGPADGEASEDEARAILKQLKLRLG